MDDIQGVAHFTVASTSGARPLLRTLHTERVILEPLTAQHADEMFAGLSDPDLHRYMGGSPPESADWLRQRYERLSIRQSPDGREQWWNWVLRLRSNSRLIGTVQATIAGGEAEIAYVLFHTFWYSGRARESVSAMIEELKTIGVTSICASVDCDNRRSRRLVEVLGFDIRPFPAWRIQDAATDVWYVLDGENLQSWQRPVDR